MSKLQLLEARLRQLRNRRANTRNGQERIRVFDEAFVIAREVELLKSSATISVAAPPRG